MVLLYSIVSELELLQVVEVELLQAVRLAAVSQIREFTPPGLANTAWAFAPLPVAGA